MTTLPAGIYLKGVIYLFLKGTFMKATDYDAQKFVNSFKHFIAPAVINTMLHQEIQMCAHIFSAPGSRHTGLKSLWNEEVSKKKTRASI